MTARDDGELAALPDILAWRDSPLPERWRGRFLTRLRERLAALADVAAPEDAAIVAGLGLLPADAQLELARAPWLSDGLLRPDGPIVHRPIMARSLVAAFARAGEPVPEAGEWWTAHGDQRVDDTGRVEPAVRVHDIRVDHASPAEFPRMELGGNRLRLLRPDERTAACATIDAALGALRGHRPHLHRWIVEFTEVLVVRGEDEEAGEFRSGTFDRYVGLVMLTNPHLAAVSREHMANALVHETIHNLLFTVETIDRRFVQSDGPVDVHVTSPWSGASLSLPSYVHACAVWYGLYHLWDGVLAEGCAAFDRGRAELLRRRAAVGFGRRPVSQGLREVRERLTPAIAGVLAELEVRMLERSAREGDAPLA